MAAAGATNDDGPAIYLTLGHGDDDVNTSFESRIELPPGYTLVTMTQCGSLVKTGSVHPLMDLFCRPDMKPLLQNPQEYKPAISMFTRVPINVYTSGDRIPDLGLQLFLDWTIRKPTEEPKLLVQRSGVYKFPTECLEMINPTNEHYNRKRAKTKHVLADFHRLTKKPVTLKNKDEILKMYEHSLLPTESDINSLFMDNTEIPYEIIKKSTYYKLSTIFERLGPGIYFFSACRGLHRNNESGSGISTINTMVKNIFRSPNNRIQHYPAVFPRVLDVATEARKVSRRPAWAPPAHLNLHSSALPIETMNEPRFLKHTFRKVMRTRRQSLNQQKKYMTEEDVGSVEAVGGAGAAPKSAANFKPLNEGSSLDEVLSELPHLRMKGVDDEMMIREYQTMIERYPQHRDGIYKDLLRILLNTLPSITYLRSLSLEDSNQLLSDRLVEIQRVYGHVEYPEFIKPITERITLLKRTLLGSRGGAQTRRRRKY